MKMWKIYKGFLPWWPDKFSHDYATWAHNHNGWSKSKKSSRRIAKKRSKMAWEKEIEDVLGEIEWYDTPSEIYAELDHNNNYIITAQNNLE